MRKLLSLFLLLMSLALPASAATNYSQMMIYVPGVGWQNAQGDENNNLIVRPTAPFLSGIYTAAFQVPLTKGFKIIGNGWGDYYRNEDAYMYIRHAYSGSAVDPVYIRLFASDDNISWQPVTPVTLWGTTAGAADTSRCDTLGFTLNSAGTGGTAREIRVALPKALLGFVGRYIGIAAWRDSTNGTAANITVTFEGRGR